MNHLNKEQVSTANNVILNEVKIGNSENTIEVSELNALFKPTFDEVAEFFSLPIELVDGRLSFNEDELQNWIRNNTEYENVVDGPPRLKYH